MTEHQTFEDLLSESLPWAVRIQGCEYYVTGKHGRITPDLGNSEFAAALALWMVQRSQELKDRKRSIMNTHPPESFAQTVGRIRRGAGGNGQGFLDTSESDDKTP